MTVRATAAVSGTLIISLACHFAALQDPVAQMTEAIRSADLKTVTSVQNAVSNAKSATHAVMFLHVDWAPMEPQRTLFAEFARQYLQTHASDSVQFYYLDVTQTHSYDPLRSIPGWKELENASEFPGQSLIHGRGEVVWLDTGQAMHVERIENFKTTNALVNFTEKLMIMSDAF